MLKGINKSDVRQQITQSIKNAEASGQITPDQAKLLAGKYYEAGANSTRIPGQPQQQATSVATNNRLDTTLGSPTNQSSPNLGSSDRTPMQEELQSQLQSPLLPTYQPELVG